MGVEDRLPFPFDKAAGAAVTVVGGLGGYALERVGEVMQAGAVANMDEVRQQPAQKAAEEQRILAALDEIDAQDTPES